jgi:hypothetical protein
MLAEHHAAARGAEQECGGGIAHPLGDEGVVEGETLGLLHLEQGGSRDQRKQAHFHAIEHPAQKCGGEDGEETFLIGRV